MSGCRLGRVNQRPGSKSYRQEDTVMDTAAGWHHEIYYNYIHSWSWVDIVIF